MGQDGGGWQRRQNNGRSQWCLGIKTEQILGQLNTSHRLYIYDEIGTVRNINEYIHLGR